MKLLFVVVVVPTVFFLRLCCPYDFSMEGDFDGDLLLTVVLLLMLAAASAAAVVPKEFARMLRMSS